MMANDIISTYEGVAIRLDSNGKFTAVLNGKSHTAASLTGLKSALKKAHVGEATGRLEGLSRPVAGGLQYGLRLPDPIVIVGVSARNIRSGYRRGEAEAVYLTPGTRGPVEAFATPLVRSDEVLDRRLRDLQARYAAAVAKFNEELKEITAEYEVVSVEDVKRLLEESQ